MAKILLDLRMVRGAVHGIARYALELARRLPALAPDLRFEGLTGPEGLPSELGPLQPDLPLRRCAAPFLSALEQPALAVALFAARCDLFHATSFSLPALWPGPLVATLHDANHLALKEQYGAGQAAYYSLVVGPRARFARALITVSEFSRAELATHLGLSPYRLQVIAQGVDVRFEPPLPASAEAFRRRHGLPPHYLATVGSPKAHKNLALVARLASRLPQPVALLGGYGAKAAFGFPATTVELNALPEAEMPLFYGAATALLFPSRYEGFGLPALEALASGVPVVASRSSALPEVVGEAGVLLDPSDEQAWVEAVQRICRDSAWRAKLSALGRERAARFSWDHCARQTLAVYRRTLR